MQIAAAACGFLLVETVTLPAEYTKSRLAKPAAADPHGRKTTTMLAQELRAAVEIAIKYGHARYEYSNPAQDYSRSK